MIPPKTPKGKKSKQLKQMRFVEVKGVQLTQRIEEKKKTWFQNTPKKKPCFR